MLIEKKTCHVEFIHTNTCSIDYFLIIVFIIYNNIKNLKYLDQALGECYKKISGYVASNNWNMARYTLFLFAEIKNIKKGNVLNWYLSEYESFKFTYSSYQLYKFDKKCDSDNCIFSTHETHFSHNLVYRYI